MLQIGSLVDNKYKILSEVGHGGMSVVYLAINERANKTWAVKEVRKDGVCDFEAVKQGLIVETDMLKKLNHPHLPSIIDVIDTEDSFLIVMDYIEGKSLHSLLKNGGAQPKDLVIKWSIQLCDVLGYLHSRTPAIIYRDMKPANVMMKPSGDITLIDFGTAREFKNRAMVEDTTCLGTRGYAAPEQFGGRGQTDPRTDIYCLGATMYHLITGHSPAEPPYEIKPLSYWDPAYYGTGLEQIINKCCQQDPDARYQSCAELMYDLEHADEMDVKVRQGRKKKWRAFLASAIACGIGVAGMVGCYFAKDHAISQSYDSHVHHAQEYVGEDLNQVASYVQSALDVDPTEKDAYEVLLTAIEHDGVLNYAEEMPILLRCINSTGEGENNTHIERLSRSNPEAYANVNFRIGKLLALMGDGGNDNLIKAAYYFRNALTVWNESAPEDADSQNKAKLAETLATIGDSIGQLKQTGSSGGFFTENEYSYAYLWSDLTKLEQEFKIDTMESYAYGISLYGRIAYMIYDNSQNFTDYNITADEMMGLLDKLDQALLSAQALPTVGERYDELFTVALGNVATARNRLNAMGASAQQGVENEGGANG